MKSALLLDLNNLYWSVKTKFGDNRRIKFEDYVRVLNERGHTFLHKIVFVRQKNSPSPFRTMLLHHGFECHFDIQRPALPMALRLAEILSHVEAVVIGSNIEDVGDILAWAKQQGKFTTCFAANVPKIFNRHSKCLEIDEGVLDAITVPTE